MVNKLKEVLNYIYYGILENLFFTSEECLLCKGICEEPYICNKCISKIKLCGDKYYICNKEYNICCYSLAYYASPIKEIIFKLKFNKNPIASLVLINLLIKHISIDYEDIDLITYVPMMKKDEKKRGYNQSKLLAEYLGNKNNIKLISSVIKVENTKNQIGLDRRNRWENMQGAFVLKAKKQCIKDKKIVIVDDVITTGATCFYCAKELIDGGAKEVLILSVAKSGIGSKITV
ncbi:MAG: ComF family protein [Clostridium sp.]